MIGNNSCGVHSVMAGLTADNVEALDVLTSDGTRLRVGRTSDAEAAAIAGDSGRRGEIYASLRALRDRHRAEIRSRYPRIPRRVSGYNLDALVSDEGFDVARALVGRGATLAPLMRRAGFRYVFLGIENVLEDDLVFLKARAKNSRQQAGGGRVNSVLAAVNILQRHGMLVVGGLIVGNPDDRRESVAANLEFARRHIDWPYIQHPTPYPGTPMTRDFEERGLVVNPRLGEYDGTTAVTRSAHLEPEEIEFMRWKAERWMKVRHLPAVFRHDPWFVLRNGRRMLAHTFRGTTWRTVLRLERDLDAFRRYRHIRDRERELVDWPDPLERMSAGNLGHSLVCILHLHLVIDQVAGRCHHGSVSWCGTRHRSRLCAARRAHWTTRSRTRRTGGCAAGR